MISLQLCRNTIIRFLVALLLITSLILPPCSYAEDAEDSQIFISGFNAYQQKDYASTIDKMNEVLTKYPDSPLRDMVLFWLSRAYYKTGNQQEAAKNLSLFAKEYPDNPLKSTVEEELTQLVERYDKGEKLPVGKPPVAKAPLASVAQKQKADEARKAAEKAAAEKAEAERLAKAKAEEERLASAKLAAEKLANQKAEAERVLLAKAEAQRLELAKAAAEKEAVEKAAALELTRQAALKAEEDRKAAAKAEADRLASIKAEEERLAAAKISAQKAETERLAKLKADEEKAAAEKLAAEKAEAERILVAKAESERLALAKAAVEKEAAEKAAALELTRQAALKAEEDRKAASKAEAERLASINAEEERLAAAKISAQKAETERLAKLKAEEEKLAAEKLAAEKAEAERVLVAKAESERIALAKAEEERLLVAKRESERLAAAQAAAEKAAADKITAEQNELVRQAQIKAEQAKIALEKEAVARAEAEKLAAIKVEEERLAAIKAEEAEMARLAAIKAADEQQKASKIAEEKYASEQESAKIAAEKAAAEKAEAQRLTALTVEKERLAAAKAKEEEERLAAIKAEEQQVAARKAENERIEQEKQAAAMAKKKALREKAIAEFKSVIDRYPGTKSAIVAAAKLKEIGVAVAIPVTETAETEQLPENTQILKLEVAQFAGFEFNLLTEPKSYDVAQLISIPFEVHNRGNGNDSFALESGFPEQFKAWFSSVAAPGSTITQTPSIAPGESFKGNVNLVIPAASIDGLRFTHPVKATSIFMPEATQSREIKLTAAAPLLRAIIKTAKTSPFPGEKVSYKVVILNVGSVAAKDVTFRLDYPPQFEPSDGSASGFKQESKGVMTLSGLNVASGESKEFTLDFILKNDSLAGQELLTRAEIRNNRLETSAVFISNAAMVQAKRGVVVRSALSRLTVIPGQTVTVPFVVTNSGNVREKFTMSSTVTGAKEAVVFHDINRDGIRQANEPIISEVGPLAPKEEASIVIEIKTPKTALDRSEGNARITFSSEGEPTSNFIGDTKLVYSRPVLQMAMAGKSGQLKPGDVAAFDLTLNNSGSNLARIVELVSYWPSQLELVAAEPAISSSTDGKILWKFKEVGAGEKKSIKVSFKVKPGTGVGTAIQVKNSLKYEDQLGNRY